MKTHIEEINADYDGVSHRRFIVCDSSNHRLVVCAKKEAAKNVQTALADKSVLWSGEAQRLLSN